MDEHTSLLRNFVNYGRKTFNNIGPRTQLLMVNFRLLLKHTLHFSYQAMTNFGMEFKTQAYYAMV
jgi:hypothetical protein